MKRGRPLARRTPMPRGDSQLARTGRLPHRSAKTATKYRTVRVPLVAALLAEHPVCQRCSSAPSTDVHEPKLRSRGGDPYDKKQCVALCRDCHNWTHANPSAATDEGWMRHSWDTGEVA